MRRGRFVLRLLLPVKLRAVLSTLTVFSFTDGDGFLTTFLALLALSFRGRDLARLLLRCPNFALFAVVALRAICWTVREASPSGNGFANGGRAG